MSQQNHNITAVEDARLKHYSRVEALYQAAMQLTITTEDELSNASMFLLKLRDARDAYEASRVSLVKPLNDHVKFINGQFAPIGKKIEQIEMYVKSLVTQFRKRQEETRLKLEAGLKEEIKEAGAPSEVAEQISVPQQKTVGGITFRTVWAWDLLNFTEVSDTYKTLNETKINKAIQSGERVISGLRIYSKEIPSLRR